MQVLGIQIRSPLSTALELQKEANTQSLNQPVRNALENPTKTIKELQAPSPLGQFVRYEA